MPARVNSPARTTLQSGVLGVAIVAVATGVLWLSRSHLSRERLMLGGSALFLLAGVLVIATALRVLVKSLGEADKKRGTRLLLQGAFYVVAGAGWLWVTRMLFGR